MILRSLGILTINTFYWYTTMIMILLLIFVLAVLLGGSFYAYRRVFFSPHEGREKIPDFSSHRYDNDRERILSFCEKLINRPCEYVTIESMDGWTLSGRYYHQQDGAPLDIGFHGYKSSCLTDFSGGSLLSFEMGHNLLLVDQRSHGKSQGHTIAFGILERYDVLSWVDYAIERFGADTKITLYGISMGAATVLMASAFDLPENVKGIVADCPYSSPKDIICHVMMQEGMKPALVWPFVRLAARIYGGFHICDTSAAQSVKTAKIPILLFHGEADSFVPCGMSAKIQLANPDRVRRYTFPGADHGLSFMIDAPRYRKLILDFANEILA